MWTAFCVAVFLIVLMPGYGVVDRWFSPYRGVAESTVSLLPREAAGGGPASYRRLVLTEMIESKCSGWVRDGTPWSGDGRRAERTSHRFVVQLDLNDGTSRQLFIDALDGMRWSRFGFDDEKESHAAFDRATALAWMREDGMKKEKQAKDDKEHNIKTRANDEASETLQQQTRFWVDLIHQAAASETTTPQHLDRQTVGRLSRVVAQMRNQWINDKKELPFHDDWVGTEKVSFDPVGSLSCCSWLCFGALMHWLWHTGARFLSRKLPG